MPIRSVRLTTSKALFEDSDYDESRGTLAKELRTIVIDVLSEEGKRRISLKSVPIQSFVDNQPNEDSCDILIEVEGTRATKEYIPVDQLVTDLIRRIREVLLNLNFPLESTCRAKITLSGKSQSLTFQILKED